MVKYIKHSIYLGRNISDMGQVSDVAMQAFLRDHVDTVYEAYTIIDCKGTWDGDHEPTTIIEIMLPFDPLALGDNSLPYYITVICENYKREFDQECVLVTSEVISGTFV